MNRYSNDTQPSNDELQTAWTDCIHAQGIPGAFGDAVQRLRALREQRTTWFGVKENELRVALDKYLSGDLA